MVSLTIDGKSVQVEKGTTILEAAATVGIKIPTLCWLKKVSPTGACRVCAVEVEGVDRTMTACNTPVKEGIKVTTDTPALKEARKKIMELMLVNHPLDCPVCDAGGECDLQDSCYGLGATRQEYSAVLERRPIRYDWPILESDPNRCILCEKCVKVDHEVVGCNAIEVVDRGEATIIDTVDGKPLNCEFCGNCAAVCPTGALITKSFKFKGRPWSFARVQSVCNFCGSGCQIEYHAKEGRVMRVTSDDATFNDGNLCINGRFGYSYLESPERLTTPMVKDGSGKLAICDWKTAISTAAGKLKEIVSRDGAAAVAGLGSPRVTNEESFLFQKFLKGAVGTGNVDSEAGLGFAQAQALMAEKFGFTGTSATIDTIDKAQAIIVFGTDLNAEATNVEYRVIKAATKNDAKLILANMRDVKLKKFANKNLKYLPGSELSLIYALMKAILESGAPLPAGAEALKADLDAVTLTDLAAQCGIPADSIAQAGKLIAGKERVALIFGSDVIRSQQAAAKVAALADLAVIAGANRENGGVFPLDPKNNTVGLLDMGVAPAASAQGLWGIVEGIEKGSIKALYLMGCDLAGFPESARMKKALAKLELLIVQDIFHNDSLPFADVVFPAAAAAEKSGTFTSSDNRVQPLAKSINAPGDARDDAAILADLYTAYTGTTQKGSHWAIFCELEDATPYKESNGSYRKAAPAVKSAHAFAPVAKAAASAQGKLQLLVGAIGFHNGTSTTRSENNLSVSPAGYIELHHTDAVSLGIKDGGQVKLSSAAGSVTGTAKVSDKVQPGLLFAPVHFRDLNANGALLGNSNIVEVKVEKA
ncbi:NADH-quinone oxidoreductase subunit NuoG [Geomonas sp. Red32]|uniref:NADH-quinone oxidoreductase subunit NuoG n=1 Tax=Geomonas sp. Red32 TaxID=2912856 RepID=UPI00202D0C27|nr:NADH-quinone oxidoreductase subunit NuoG [Geomonas sp. Red32]MCM0080071.1 NADH-quinone oxidoreductase subunit NuoG [Geomonas sp. Red32]